MTSYLLQKEAGTQVLINDFIKFVNLGSSASAPTRQHVHVFPKLRLASSGSDSEPHRAEVVTDAFVTYLDGFSDHSMALVRTRQWGPREFSELNKTTWPMHQVLTCSTESFSQMNDIFALKRAGLELSTILVIGAKCMYDTDGQLANVGAYLPEVVSRCIAV